MAQHQRPHHDGPRLGVQRIGCLVLRVTRTQSDGSTEQTTVIELATGEMIVSVDGVEQRQRHESLEAAIRSESVLHSVDDRETTIESPVLASWQLTDLLDGDGAEINGTAWVLTADGSWWPEDVWEDPDHDDDVAYATFKVPGAGSMTGGPVSGIRLERLGDRYWFHDWEREIHDRTRASTPMEAVQWFTDGLDGKIVDFSSPLLVGLDDEAIADLLPGWGPALWVNGDLWERAEGRWARRPELPPIEVPDIEPQRVELCEHIGSGSDDYRWLGLSLTPAVLPQTPEPQWWWVLVADANPDLDLLAFLADAVFGSTVDATPNHPPTVIAHLADGTRWVGLATDHASIAEKLASTTDQAVRLAGNPSLVWVIDGDGHPAGPAWTYDRAEIEPPTDADVLPLVDPSW